MMEFEKIIELIHAVSESNLTEFKMQQGDLKISMATDKETKQITVAAPVMAAQPEMITAAVPQAAVQAVPSAQTEEAEEKKITGNVVKSPLVGTYYEASSPDSDPFVKVGDTVKKGQVLGIVEAMKLMNEIESEFDGTVKEILVKNEQLVEYGQPMFVIE